MKKTIKVTQEHIDKGKRIDSQSCPIALACKETGLSEFLVVDKCSISYFDSKTAYKGKFGLWNYSYILLPLPDEARYFINKFDEGLKVEPFEFEIEI